MKNFVITSTLLALSAASQVRAANDWKKPCWGGACEYDIARSEASIPATLKVWGAENAISDITQAGGWHILGCDSDATTQDIRLVCQNTDLESAGCDHITQNGAVGTLVRLPENCGKAPFALVTTWGESEDQSVPEDVAQQIVRSEKRADSTVMALTLDSTFDNADPAKQGVVSFAVIGASANDDPAVLAIPAQRRRSARAERLARRGFFDSIKNVFNKVKDTVVKTVDKIVDKVEDVVDDINNVDVNKTFSFPITVDKTVNLASANVVCAPIPDVSLSADAALKADGAITLGVVVAGTIIPVDVDTFSLSAGLNADLNAQLTLKATTSGSVFDSGDVQLFSAGVPGLDIPGILQVGPTFAINGRANVNIGAQVDMVVGINYKANNVVFQFPPNKDLASTGEAVPKDSPLTLSVSPDLKLNGDVTAHIIPSLNFGINLLAGKAEADIFVNLDTSATLSVSVDGKADLSKTIQTKRRIAADLAERELAERDLSGSINGCVGMTTGVSANVGAKGQFFSLFDANTALPLFNKQFQLFNKCFGTSTAKRAFSTLEAPRAFSAREAKTLTCPTAAAAAPEKVTDGTVPAAEISATPVATA